jgi:hypothetical protein
MNTATFTGILRYGGIISQVMAAASCLAGDSRNPVTDPASNVTTNLQQKAARLLLSPTRVMVSVETAQKTSITTQMLFFHDSPPPWKLGNALGLRGEKASVSGQTNDWQYWRVINMHTENFFEVARRMRMSSVEVHLIQIRVEELGRPDERTANYAIVTDARIPRNWYLFEPRVNFSDRTRLEAKTVRELKAAYPENFRALD